MVEQFPQQCRHVLETLGIVYRNDALARESIRHRRNSLFYKTRHGAHVGDVFMSLIHTCELGEVNPFDYLTELERHALEAASNPGEWMPWNYRKTLDAATALDATR